MKVSDISKNKKVMKSLYLKSICLILLFLSLEEGTSQDLGKRTARYKYSDQQPYKLEHLKALDQQLILKVNKIDSLKNDVIGTETRLGYLINNSDSTQKILTQDQNLIMIMEAKDSTNHWLPIELWASSSCGNSYTYPLILKKENYVTFKIPNYTGPIKTTMRLQLFANDQIIYSNEFWGGVTKKQLYEKVIESTNQTPY